MEKAALDVLFFGLYICNNIKQKTNLAAKNSTIAKILAASDDIDRIEHLQIFLHAQGYNLRCPIMYQDNTSAITLLTTGPGKQTNRHIRARIGYIKDLITSSKLQLKYIRTQFMIADTLTKPLQCAKFAWTTRRLLGFPYTHNYSATGVC